jgi:DNA-binding response OmpR family regulator
MDPQNPAIYDAQILIVDDNQNNADTLQEMLLLAGFALVSTLTDPRLAVNQMRDTAPSLLILDLHMPHLSGLDILEQLHGNTPNPMAFDVIMLTGDKEMTGKVRALELGAADFITKPFNFLEIRTKIQNLLERRLLYKALENQKQWLEEQVHLRTQALLQINDDMAIQNQKLLEIATLQGQSIQNPLSRFLEEVQKLTNNSEIGESEQLEQLVTCKKAAQELDQIIKNINQLAHSSHLPAAQIETPLPKK